jgi:ribosome-associated protein
MGNHFPEMPVISSDFQNRPATGRRLKLPIGGSQARDRAAPRARHRVARRVPSGRPRPLRLVLPWLAVARLRHFRAGWIPGRVKNMRKIDKLEPPIWRNRLTHSTPGGAAREAGVAERIEITRSISISADELQERFVRASGPGGQNVNKLSSAVQLRFDVRRSPGLPQDMRERLERLAGRRLTHEGVLVLVAQNHRTQERNRQDARERLLELLREAAIRPVIRRPTRPTLASKTRRLENKTRRSTLKSLRSKARSD